LEVPVLGIGSRKSRWADQSRPMIAASRGGIRIFQDLSENFLFRSSRRACRDEKLALRG